MQQNILGVEDNALRRTFKERQLSDDSFRQLKEVDLNLTFHQKILKIDLKKLQEILETLMYLKKLNLL